MPGINYLLWTVRHAINTPEEAMSKEWLTPVEREELRKLLESEDLLDGA